LGRAVRLHVRRREQGERGLCGGRRAQARTAAKTNQALSLLLSPPNHKTPFLQGEIYQSIEWLDKLAMSIIEEGDPAAWSRYLARYRNTVCGRHPIGVLLQAMKASRTSFRTTFRCYDQSSQARDPSDSSVSYASALICLA